MLEGKDLLEFWLLISKAISVDKHKKKRLPILSVSMRSLKKFTTMIILIITPIVIDAIL